MAILATISVMTYWLFYFLQIKKTKPEILRPNIQNHFVECLVLGGNQDSCAVQLAPYLPPFGLIMMAELVVACVGIIVFIIFFRPALMIEWRELFERLRFFLSRSGQKKEEHEFVEI
ncbi:hypothetical protein BGZ79_001027 [Entomortierella chlamydospora]|nr:hypothetical protein BGZ79_001027 [Entomortierella chlamydospora]